MDYMIRFTQVHETFRLAEIQALAVLEDIDLEVLSYSPDVSLRIQIFISYSRYVVTILLCQVALC